MRRKIRIMSYKFWFKLFKKMGNWYYQGALIHQEKGDKIIIDEKMNIVDKADKLKNENIKLKYYRKQYETCIKGMNAALRGLMKEVEA